MSDFPPPAGAPLDPVPPGSPEDRRRIQDRLDRRFSRPQPATWLLLLAVVLLHGITGMEDYLAERATAWQALFGERSVYALQAWGARSAPRVRDGETWRLLSSVFLHRDLLHFALNGLALFGLGRICEAVFGSVRFALLFVASGLAGSLLSQFGGVDLSAGASGGLFGLMGAGVVFGVRHRRRLDPHQRHLFTRWLAPWILLNLFIGVTVPHIDNLAHTGGLAGGAAVAAVLGSPVIPGREGRFGVSVAAGFALGLALGWTVAGILRFRLGGLG